MSVRSKRRAERQRRFPIATVLAVGGGLLLVGAAVALLRAPYAPPAEIEVTGQPRLRVDKEVLDLGDVRLGRTVEATFVLTNVGDRPLHFLQEPYIEVVEGC
jgi:cell division septal protein FtsQ